MEMLPTQGVPDAVPQLQTEFLFNIFFPLSRQNQSMGINTIELLLGIPAAKSEWDIVRMTGFSPGKVGAPGEGSSKAEYCQVCPVNAR